MEKLRQEMRARRYASRDISLEVLVRENKARREEEGRLRMKKEEEELMRAMQHFFYNLWRL